ncbi:hypothetical protein PR001_g6827 [Phytophthora rubi]|uniref:Integrase catalytic domain-containing protein n=1 Tax=Phytophthora rubi TaxID=129364 RepID=A0A6A3NIY7_9STRA|nr:hypothetical protein PR002_g17579 [Phytophthora rubi]KAE9040988.1 hypothetical protein PR001_g6827 [Phytophthora rubi]
MRACDFKLEFNDDQSTAWLCKDGLKLRFDCNGMLYRMRVKRSVRFVGAVEQRKNAMGLLHNRLGHANMKLIRELASEKVDFGININMQSLKDYDCFPCLSAKAKRPTYKPGSTRRNHPLEKLSMGLCCINRETAAGETISLLVVDEATRYRCCYLLKYKDEAVAPVETLVLKLNNQIKRAGHSVKLLHSDRGGEFVNDYLRVFCLKEGIEFKTTNG